MAFRIYYFKICNIYVKASIFNLLPHLHRHGTAKPFQEEKIYIRLLCFQNQEGMELYFNASVHLKEEIHAAQVCVHFSHTYKLILSINRGSYTILEGKPRGEKKSWKT
jgi:hypothetical protein